MTLRNSPLSMLLISFVILILFSQCKDHEVIIDDLPPLTSNEIISQYLDIDLENLDNYANPDYPIHYDENILQNDNAPSINKVTDAGATLGRVLFYDVNLSLNNTVACASCHKQELGFTDDRKLSLGFLGGETGRHSMRLANANFYTGERMFWDKRALDIEDQSTMPIKDHVEMGFDDSAGGIDSLLRKLSQLEYYPILFKEAFGTEIITENGIKMALAQFIRSMVSTGSKFDKGFAQAYNPALPGRGINQPFPNFTQEENMGKQLYFTPPPQGGAGCAGCHNGTTFALAANSQNNGLDADETIIFKSPSLKNIAVTGPYMHDGRFATLEEVVEHYNSGIQMGPTLDNRLRVPTPNGQQPLRLNLSQAEKDALVAFLKTLTDEALLGDEKFSDPFKG
ncbi:MAG: cytochrome-c peroxidase [Saprospirales bacterium]|nr:cytochrome-c peroxidase [Saprospirales bacterium]